VTNWKRVGEAIKQWRKSRGWNQGELGSRIGVSAASVSNWEKGVDLSYDRVFELAPHVDARPEDLLAGRGPGDRGGDSAIAKVSSLGGRIVPTYDFETVRQRYKQPGFAEEVRSNFPCSPESFALLISDRSNAPKYLPGDRVIIDPELAPEPGDMVLAFVGVDMLPVLRRVTFLQTGPAPRYALKPLNDTWPEFVVGPEEPGEIVGVVSEHTQPRR